MKKRVLKDRSGPPLSRSIIPFARKCFNGYESEFLDSEKKTIFSSFCVCGSCLYVESPTGAIMLIFVFGLLGRRVGKVFLFLFVSTREKSRKSVCRGFVSEVGVCFEGFCFKV